MRANNTVYVNRDTFLVEILGMTNNCNLRCEYCDWEKKKFVPLSDEEKNNVWRNLTNTKKFIDIHYPEAQIIEYSGGEPFMYPEIVWQLVDTFPNHWIRIITNATLLRKKDIDKLASHGKTFLAISLDGHTLEANHSRGLTQKQFDKIISNIDYALHSNVPVMLLCTLNEDNVDFFKEYVKYLDNKWNEFICNGMLVLPAHMLSSYSVAHRFAKKDQVDAFKKSINSIDSLLIKNIKKHYNSLYTTKQKQCSVYQWATSIHFIGNSIATTGDFTTFRCGMRGVGKIGVFNINDEVENDIYSNIMNVALEVDFASYKCNCVVDWNAIDLILSRCISLRQAEKWFVLFKDKNVQNWLLNHKNSFTTAYTCGGRNKIPCIKKRIC